MSEYWDMVYGEVKERIDSMAYADGEFSVRNYSNVSHWAYNILVGVGKPAAKTQQFEAVINGMVNAYTEGFDQGRYPQL